VQDNTKPRGEQKRLAFSFRWGGIYPLATDMMDDVSADDDWQITGPITGSESKQDKRRDKPRKHTHTHTHNTGRNGHNKGLFVFCLGRSFEINRLHPPFNTFFYDPPKIFVKKALPDNLLLLVFVFRHVLIWNLTSVLSREGMSIA